MCFEGLGWRPKNIIKLFGGLAHPRDHIESITLTGELIIGDISPFYSRIILHSKCLVERLPGVGKKIIIECCFIGVAAVHKGIGKSGQFVDVVVQLCTIGLDNGWVVLHELHEVVDDVGEEDGEEDCCSDE